MPDDAQDHLQQAYNGEHNGQIDGRDDEAHEQMPQMDQ